MQNPTQPSPHWELLSHPCFLRLGAGGDLHPVLPGWRALLAFDPMGWMKQHLGVQIRAGSSEQGGNCSCVRSQASTHSQRARKCVWKAVEYRQAPRLAVTCPACRGSPHASGCLWLCHTPTGDRGPVLCSMPFSVCSEQLQDVILQEQSTLPDSEL